jgi:hypothetical protein
MNVLAPFSGFYLREQEQMLAKVPDIEDQSTMTSMVDYIFDISCIEPLTDSRGED